jgi:hypothetical protein
MKSSVAMDHKILIGGMIAGGFDASGRYLLTVSHSGRGVYETSTWEKLVRDYDEAYPENGCVLGIGPIADELIPVTEMDYETGIIAFSNADDTLRVRYSEGTMTVQSFQRKEHRGDWPFFVRLGLWGISTRATACKFVLLSLLTTFTFLVAGLFHPIFLIGLICFFPTYWYIYAIRWVDEFGNWDRTSK